jgi:adhesin transport system outer membrane protein
MNRFAGAALVLVLGCGCQRRIVVQPPKDDAVVLLSNPETNTVGRAIVSSLLGAREELTTERAFTRVVIGQPPTAPVTISEAEVQRLFGDALAARPPAPRRFLLYFVSGSNQLTPASKTELTAISDFITSRPVPDVTVIGHTDTTGTAHENIELGRGRAATIRDRLVATGLDSRLVSVASHGEADLLVPTPDDTEEPRNRRVEVSVR